MKLTPKQRNVVSALGILPLGLVVLAAITANIKHEPATAHAAAQAQANLEQHSIALQQQSPAHAIIGRNQEAPSVVDKAPSAIAQPAQPSPPPVVRKLYLDVYDMDELMEANLRIEAIDYGFQLVGARSHADVILSGSGGVVKKEGFPFDSCMPFYSFDVTTARLKHNKAKHLQLSLGVPNDFPCVEVAAAKRILSELRDGCSSLEIGKAEISSNEPGH